MPKARSKAILGRGSGDRRRVHRSAVV